MKSLLSLFVVLLASLVSAISSTGDRLLAVFDDVADKTSYSKFLGDLESQSISIAPRDPLSRLELQAHQFITGRGFKITFETPKSESVSLFHLGERTYDHVILFPSKSKGTYSPGRSYTFTAASANRIAS